MMMILTMKKGQFPLDKPASSGRKCQEATPLDEAQEYIDIHQIQKHILESRGSLNSPSRSCLSTRTSGSTLAPPPYYPYNVQIPTTPGGNTFIPEDCFNFWFNSTTGSINQTSGKKPPRALYSPLFSFLYLISTLNG
ncbi:hypothetical protein WDU94_012645 [Cyamophila willieti]